MMVAWIHKLTKNSYIGFGLSVY